MASVWRSGRPWATSALPSSFVATTPSDPAVRIRSCGTESANRGPKIVVQSTGASRATAIARAIVITTAARKTTAVWRAAPAGSSRTRFGRCTCASAVGRKNSASDHETAML